jgi:hypothetical protein
MTTPLPMTKGRRLALLLGVPFALALVGWTGLTEVAYAGLGSYPVRLAVPVHGSTVGLSTSAADVQVTQAAGSTLRRHRHPRPGQPGRGRLRRFR